MHHVISASSSLLCFPGTIIIMSVQYAGTLPSTPVLVTVDGGVCKETTIAIERLVDLHLSSQSAVQSVSTTLSGSRVGLHVPVCDHRNCILALGNPVTTKDPNQIIIGRVDHVSLAFNVTLTIPLEDAPRLVALNKDGSKLAVFLENGLFLLKKFVECIIISIFALQAYC